MRESQMKKIIALAVASAFAVPAFAADVTVSGEIEMTYVSNTGSQDTASNADSNVAITATEEVNGISVSGTVNFSQDEAYDDEEEAAGAGAANGSDNAAVLTLGLPNGLSLSMGDTAGAMDAVGDYTDMAPAYGGFGADGADHSFLVSMAIGPATVYASQSPQGGAYDSATADSTAVGAKVGFDGGEVYFATQEDADSKWNSYGVKYSAMGLTVAFEKGADDAGSSADIKYTGLGATYTMGDVVIGAESQETKTDGSAASVDDVVTFIEYNLGSSVDLYVSQRSSSGTSSDNDDGTTVGVEFVF
jgi:hypothetical protein